MYKTFHKLRKIFRPHLSPSLQAVSSLSPSEGERAGERGPFGPVPVNSMLVEGWGESPVRSLFAAPVSYALTRLVVHLSCASTLAILLFSGCSRQTPQESAPPKFVSLGTVELSSGTPSRHDLGGGTWCVITVQPLGPGNIELFGVLEKSGKQVASTRAAPVTTDQPLEISFGDTRIGLVPHLK